MFGLILLTEILIALFAHDKIIRPFVGDILVVVLIYCFLCFFINYNHAKIAFAVLIFSFTIEILQAFHFVKLLGFEHNKIISTVLGNTFSVYDLMSYLLGYFICRWMK